MGGQRNAGAGQVKLSRPIDEPARRTGTSATEASFHPDFLISHRIGPDTRRFTRYFYCRLVSRMVTWRSLGCLNGSFQCQSFKFRKSRYPRRAPKTFKNNRPVHAFPGRICQPGDTPEAAWGGCRACQHDQLFCVLRKRDGQGLPGPRERCRVPAPRGGRAPAPPPSTQARPQVARSKPLSYIFHEFVSVSPGHCLHRTRLLSKKVSCKWQVFF
jgi:hypothetical protein